MDNNNKIIVGALIVLTVLAGGYFLWASMNNNQVTVSQDTNTTTNNPPAENQNPVPTPTPVTHVVTYTDSGYSPTELTIKVGDTVTWKNESSGTDWVGSAMHPTHTAYSGTTLQQHCPDPDNNDFDECKADKPGDSWSFTFTKVGTWGYHNHVKSSHFGKITVQP